MTVRSCAWRQRTHVLLAAAATAWTVSCGDYGSEHCSLSLPDQPVELTVGRPKHRSRFLVESHNGRFGLRLTFATQDASLPKLDVQPVDPTREYVYQTRSSVEGSRRDWAGQATVNCGDEFPCVGQFEAIVTANTTTSGTVNGTLAIAASSSDCSLNPDAVYLAIEPL